MITVNILDILTYLMGVFAIHGILPEQFKHEIGSIVEAILQLAWFVVSIIALGFWYNIKIIPQ